MAKKQQKTLMKTRDYSKFESHAFNRDIHDDSALEESMMKHGFMPSSPIQCVPNGKGQLKVIRGHHRLMYAKKLRLTVYYIIDKTNCDIFDLEGCRQQWTGKDFAVARAKAGDKHCAELLEFSKEYRLPVGIAALLLSGGVGEGGGGSTAVKKGTFKIKNKTRARRIADSAIYCYSKGLLFARTRRFIVALAKVVDVPEFDLDLFLRKVKTYKVKRLEICSSTLGYLDEIEKFYNYRLLPDKAFPVKYRALELSKARVGGNKKAK